MASGKCVIICYFMFFTCIVLIIFVYLQREWYGVGDGSMPYDTRDPSGLSFFIPSMGMMMKLLWRRSSTTHQMKWNKKDVLERTPFLLENITSHDV